MSNDRAARTLVTLGLLDEAKAKNALDTLDGGTWPDVLASMGLQGDELQEALAVVTAATGPLGDDAVTAESHGRYHDIVELGKGGMGVVVRSEDGHLHREVARKELLVKHPAIELRFLREARITAQLEHPGIVPVYELGRRPDGTLYYTMKEVRGRTLRDALDACGTLQERLALLGVFVDLCQAVGYAHSKGVVHRDLKPENVMIGAFGETTVLDWGLAKVAGEPDSAVPEGLQVGSGGGSDLTRAGTVMGTPKYMSPEQAVGRTDLDARSDVWSIGVMLYELLSGEVPFAGSTESILRQVQDGVFAPVEQSMRGCPPALAAICNKALGFAPAERYDHAGEVADELEAWRTGATVGAHTYTAFEQVRSAANRFRLIVVGVLGLAVGGLVANRIVSADRDAVAAELAAERQHTAVLEELTRANVAEPGAALARYWRALSLPGITDADRAAIERGVKRAVAAGGNVRVLTDEPAHDLRWTPSGGRLAWARERSVALVDPESGSDLGELPAPGIVSTFDFDHDESAIWIGTREGEVVRLSLLDRSEKARFSVGASVADIVPSPDGVSVLVRPEGGGFGLFRANGTSAPLDGALAEAAMLTWDGAHLRAVDRPNPLRSAAGSVVAGLAGPQEVVLSGRRFALASPVHRLALDPAGGHLAVGTDDGLFLWAVAAGELESNLRVCPDGRVVPVLPFPRMDDLEAPSRACAKARAPDPGGG